MWFDKCDVNKSLNDQTTITVNLPKQFVQHKSLVSLLNFQLYYFLVALIKFIEISYTTPK